MLLTTILLTILKKIKHLLTIIVRQLQYVLCLFRRRQQVNNDYVTLSYIHVVSNQSEDHESWNNWGTEVSNLKSDVSQQQTETTNDELNLFEDMTPKITKQPKIYLNANSIENLTTNRLNFSEDQLEHCELKEWDEKSGWESQTMDWAAQEALREQKKYEKERKMWEQHQKRLEKGTKVLGARILTTK